MPQGEGVARPWIRVLLCQVNTVNHQVCLGISASKWEKDSVLLEKFRYRLNDRFTYEKVGHT